MPKPPNESGLAVSIRKPLNQLVSVSATAVLSIHSPIAATNATNTIMANDPKTGKKAATKPAKSAHTHKVPKYAQDDATTAPPKSPAKK